jgi:hypothetical protein
MKRLALLVLFPLVLGVGACARGADVAPRTERQFQLDWQVLKEQRGAVVRGQLLNPYGLPARDIHLLVEGLDGSGSVVTRTTRALREIVRSGERTTFDIPVPDGAERYRVTVVAWDLVLPRGGR